MRSKSHTQMVGFLNLLSDQEVSHPISIASVLRDSRPSTRNDPGSAATAEAILNFLSILGVLSVNWDTREFTINGVTAAFALRSLRECMKLNVTLITDWEREGVSEDHIDADEFLGSGVDFLYWMETVRRMAKGAMPVKIGHVMKALIKACSTDGQDVFLVQRSEKSGRYQLIGGRRKYEGESPLVTMKRELKEELRGNRFVFDQNTFIELMASIPMEIVSPSFGAFTRWECAYFSVRFSGLELALPAGTCWATVDEFKHGCLATGEPVLRYPTQCQQNVFETFKRAPLSIQHPVDLYMQRELHLRSFAANWVDSLCHICRHHHNGRISPLALIDGICVRFTAFAKGLSARHGNRRAFKLKDEYDVQDMLHCLLTLFFADSRREEYTPSYAGSSSRMDFLLKKEGIVVETKMTRPSMTSKMIGEQLLIDAAKYRSHPDCHILYCFVYDPGCHVENPVGMERDLSQSEENFQVRVRVVQTR